MRISLRNWQDAAPVFALDTQNRYVIGVLLPIALSFLLSGLAASPVMAKNGRYALLVGESEYRFANSLPNPTNDVSALAAKLTQLGFDVTSKTNVNHRELTSVVSDFSAGLPKGAVALFYFAGHGLQVNDRNYVVPIDAEPHGPADVPYTCVAVDRVLANLNDSQASLRIVLLDCCRNNPFARSWAKRSVGAEGLARQPVPNGFRVVFSTAPGRVAEDSTGGSNNSPFVECFLQVLNSAPPSGLELQQLLVQTARLVKDQTKGRQIPWSEASDLSLGDFFIVLPQSNPMAIGELDTEHALMAKEVKAASTNAAADDKKTPSHPMEVASQPPASKGAASSKPEAKPSGPIAIRVVKDLRFRDVELLVATEIGGTAKRIDKEVTLRSTGMLFFSATPRYGSRSTKSQGDDVRLTAPVNVVNLNEDSTVRFTILSGPWKAVVEPYGEQGTRVRDSDARADSRFNQLQAPPVIGK